MARIKLNSMIDSSFLESPRSSTFLEEPPCFSLSYYDEALTSQAISFLSAGSSEISQQKRKLKQFSKSYTAFLDRTERNLTI